MEPHIITLIPINVRPIFFFTTGTNCETFITTTAATTTVQPNPCFPNPCSYGGTCIPANHFNLNINYACLCPPAYTGPNCETAVVLTTQATTVRPNPCSTNPCWYGGTCVFDGAIFACLCPPAYTGPNCETAVVLTTQAATTTATTTRPNPCSTNPCVNGGTCVQTNDNVNYACVCQPSFTGLNCQTLLVLTTQTPINPCAINPCRNNGKRDNLKTGYNVKYWFFKERYFCNLVLSNV